MTSFEIRETTAMISVLTETLSAILLWEENVSYSNVPIRYSD